MLSDEQRRRLEKEKKSFEQFYELKIEKIARLRNAFLIETDPSRKFQYEQQIKNEETELKSLTEQLDEIENKLQYPQNNLPPTKNSLFLWLKISLATGCIVVLTLLFIKFNPTDFLLINKEKNSTEVSNEISTPTSTNLVSQEVEIKILVKNDSNKKPIENAEVKLETSSGSPETKKTDDDGYARFTILKGVKARVIITKEGFKMRDKIYNETIDPNEVKTYYLIPETDISSRKSFPISPPVAVNPLPPSMSPPVAVNPLPPSMSPPVAVNPLPSPKTLPIETVKKPKNLELALLDKFTIDIFFLKDGEHINLANDIKNQLNNKGIESNIVLKGKTIEELRKAASAPPVGFEIRADYDEISVGRLLVNTLKDLYPNLGFELIKKNSPDHTDNYMSIFLDTFPDEDENGLSIEFSY